MGLLLSGVAWPDERYRGGVPVADRSDRAADVAAAVLRHPAVAGLDGGPFGTVVSYLPGRRRVLGVRIGIGAEPVELSVVARLGTPFPRLADELGRIVREMLGPVPVEVTVADVAAADGPAVVGGPPDLAPLA